MVDRQRCHPEKRDAARNLHVRDVAEKAEVSGIRVVPEAEPLSEADRQQHGNQIRDR